MNKNAKPKLGTEAFEVEWCDYLPKDDCGDTDMDKVIYKKRRFTVKRFAERFARIVYPKDVFGAVMITPVRLEDPHEGTRYAGIKSEFRWEPIGDSVEYSGDTVSTPDNA